MRTEKIFSILMIMVLSFTSFMQPLAIVGAEPLSNGEDAEEMLVVDQEVVAELNKEIDEPELEEDQIKVEEVEKETKEDKEPVKNKGDPVKKEERKENKVEKETKKEKVEVKKIDVETNKEEKKPVKDEVEDKELNGTKEKHLSEMTDDERDGLSGDIGRMSIDEFLTKSYVTPLVEKDSNYKGYVQYDFKLPNDLELRPNTNYLIRTKSSELRDFVTPEDVKSVWNEGTRWLPSNGTEDGLDEQGRPYFYFKLRDDGFVNIVFSEDFMDVSERKGTLYWDFYHSQVEKVILKDGEEVHSAEYEEGEEITYLIRSTFDGKSPSAFNNITDNLDDRLILAGDDWQEMRDSVKVYDEEGNEYNEHINYLDEVYGSYGDYRSIRFNGLNPEKVELQGKTYTLEITAKIKGSANYGEDIPNIGDIDGLNSNEVIVKKTPPEPTTPVVVKDVEGKDHLEVAHEKEYNYNVKTTIPTNLGGYKDLTITDKLDSRLDVVGTKVLVDGKQSDFEAKVVGQTVTLKLDREQLDSIAGKEVNIQITAKIQDGTDVELIDNKATIQLNDNPSEDSNVVTVIPPKPITPKVVKDVEEQEHLEVAHEKEYNYNVKTNIPKELGGHKDLTLADTLDKRLDVVGTKVLVDGKVSDFKADIKDQAVSVKFDRKQLETIAGKEVNLQITAKIQSGTDIELIDNKATIQLNDNPEVDSNVVTVIPPKPTTPVVVKDVEGKDHLEVAHEKEYNYNVKTTIPNNLGGYKDLTLTDVLDNRLDVVKANVLVDGKVSDFEAKVDGQTVTLKLDREQLDSIAGQEVNIQITAKIQDGTDVELIDNKATIQLNDNPSEDSNVVTVIPPKPTTPEVVKDVEGEDHLEIEHEKAYKYNVKTYIPTELGGYKDLTLTDALDNRLDVVKANVLVDGKVSDFEAKVDGQTVTLKLDRKQLDSIAGQEVNVQITAKIKDGTDIKVIENKATIQLNDNPSEDSNVVTVIPPNPEKPNEPESPVEPTDPEEPKVEKPTKKEKIINLIPQSGSGTDYVLIGAGLLLLILGGYFVYRKKKSAQ